MTKSPTSIRANLNTQNNTPCHNTFEICNQLEVMRNQEETTYACSDYMKDTTPSNTMIDQTCREKMYKWGFQLIGYTQFSQKTLFMAMSYLDRFLSSGSKVAENAIHNRPEYQLATMTSLYLAIKINERVELTIPTLIRITKDKRSPEQFAKMEKDILQALNWRLNGPTTLCFLEHFFELIPPEMSISNTVLRTLFSLSKLYAGLTHNDYYFVPMKPSDVAVCCISIAMQRIPSCLFNRSDRLHFFSLISLDANIDLNSLGIKKGRKQLERIVKKLPPCQSNLSQSSMQQCNKGTANESSSFFKSTSVSQRTSPVCVSREEIAGVQTVG